MFQNKKELSEIPSILYHPTSLMMKNINKKMEYRKEKLKLKPLHAELLIGIGVFRIFLIYFYL